MILIAGSKVYCPSIEITPNNMCHISEFSAKKARLGLIPENASNEL